VLGQAEKEKKNSFQVPFLANPGWSIPKKIQKFKKRHPDFISSHTRQGEAEKEIKKFQSQYCFYPTRARAFPKKIVKNSKN